MKVAKKRRLEYQNKLATLDSRTNNRGKAGLALVQIFTPPIKTILEFIRKDIAMASSFTPNLNLHTVNKSLLDAPSGKSFASYLKAGKVSASSLINCYQLTDWFFFFFFCWVLSSQTGSGWAP